MYRYRERLQGIPKIEMVSSGDEFFLCDDSLQWWNDMPGPKYMMMLPNAEHSMAPHYVQIYETAVSFWMSILDEVPLPLVSWSMTQTEGGGLIVFNTYPQPINITAFSATTLSNDTRRDFRLASLSASGEPAIHPVAWRRNVNVVDLGNGLQYGAAVEKVEGEWVGFFFQGTWEGPAPNYYRLVLTSQVNIVPDTHPRGPCLDNVECYGKLV
jgi:PhoPQ-activated pathogenicity-related protein